MSEEEADFLRLGWGTRQHFDFVNPKLGRILDKELSEEVWKEKLEYLYQRCALCCYDKKLYYVQPFPTQILDVESYTLGNGIRLCKNCSRLIAVDTEARELVFLIILFTAERHPTTLRDLD